MKDEGWGGQPLPLTPSPPSSGGSGRPALSAYDSEGVPSPQVSWLSLKFGLAAGANMW